MAQHTVTYTDAQDATIQRYLDEVVNPPRLAADPPQAALTIDEILQVRAVEIAESLHAQHIQQDAQKIGEAWKTADATTQDEVRTTLGVT